MQLNSKEPLLYKHANFLKIAYKGDAPVGIADTLQLILEEINSVTPNFQLVFAGKEKLNYGITLNFIKDNQSGKNYILPYYKSAIHEKEKFETIWNTIVTIHYNGNLCSFNNTLGNLIYKAVTMEGAPGFVDAFEFRDNETKLKANFKELLKVYYAPELPHNFKKREMEWVLREYQETEDQ